MIKIFTDGATIGKNGKLGTVKEVGLGMYIPSLNYGDSKRTKGISNNEAEFKALIWAMEYLIENNIKRAEFNTDSKIVYNRIFKGTRPKGKYKNERMDAFQNDILRMKDNFDEFKIKWIPREENETADYYSNLAKEL